MPIWKRHKGGKRPHDPDAQWGVKPQYQVKNERGEDAKQAECFLGYKMHASMNAENGLITSLEVTPGNAYDSHHFCSLVDNDLDQNLNIETYAADKGNDDGTNHYCLHHHHLKSAIHLKDTRTQKKDKNKLRWEELSAISEYQEGLKESNKIWQRFDEAKHNHELRRCRYLGLMGYAAQAFFTAKVLNFKRMVKMLTGVGSKTHCCIYA